MLYLISSGQRYHNLKELFLYLSKITAMRLCFVVIISFIVYSCVDDKKDTSRSISNVEIEIVHSDSVSIRAIQPVDANGVWFAGSNGKIGFVDGKNPKLATIQFADSLLSFRAIAKTDKAVFILSISNPAVIYKIGFNEKEATSMEEVYYEEGEKIFYDAMKFWNNLEGIAMGDPTNDCLSVIITKDGGNSWEKVSCDVLPKVEKGEAAFAASNSNIAIFEDKVWMVSGGMRARVFFSPDKGKSWKVFNTPIVEGGAMTGIYSVDFYDDNTGILFGGDWNNKENNFSNKALTTDGGKTWQLVSDGKEPGYRSSVKFVPNRNGQEIVAVGSLGISYSNDQGKNWRELSKEGFFAIEFVNDSVAFASGNNKIAKLTFKE